MDDKLKTRLLTLLNEYQVDSINNALEKGFVQENHVQELMDHDSLSDQDKTNMLIDKVVVPFNMSQLDNQIKEQIETGGHNVVCASGDDEVPTFTYSVGGLCRAGCEVLYMGNVPDKTAASFINSTLIHLEKHSGDIDTLPPLGEVDGQPIRHTVHHRKLMDYPEYLVKVFDHYSDIDPETPLYILEVGDGHNRLPGEEGYDEEFEQWSSHEMYERGKDEDVE